MRPPQDSSNELLLEVLREMASERATDRNDGLTVRSLNRRLDEHSIHDEKKHEALEGRIRSLETAAAFHEGATDTGRFPAVAPVAINLNGGPRSKRPSGHPVLKGLMENPKAVLALIGALTVLAHAILKFLK
jgi:hypothetical protein